MQQEAASSPTGEFDGVAAGPPWSGSDSAITIRVDIHEQVRKAFARCRRLRRERRMNKIALARKLAELTQEDRAEVIAFSRELASRGGPVVKKRRKKVAAKKPGPKKRPGPKPKPKPPVTAGPPPFE